MRKCNVLSALFIVLVWGFLGVVQADLNDGLMAYYPFNGNADDKSGNANHATEHGNIIYVTGKTALPPSFMKKVITFHYQHL